MNLIDGGAAAQFLRRVPKHLLISRAVVEPAAFTIHHCDHVGCVLSDELEQLVTLRKLTPDSLKLQVLVHRVDVEQQNESSQSSNPFSEISPVGSVGFGMVAEESQKDDSRSQSERDGYGKSPKPPLPAFDLAGPERRPPSAPGGGVMKIERH